ncbi:MAG: hypothetical protein WDZ49_09220 [Litorilinea sp.]
MGHQAGNREFRAQINGPRPIQRGKRAPAIPRLEVGGVRGLVCLLAGAWLVWSLWQAPPAYAIGPNEDEEIVYLDPLGFIRVLDPVQTGENLPILWSSPTGGWLDFALGDFTGDGDMEIVAVGNSGTGGMLAIFDPVYLGSNPVPGQQIGGINWVTYFDATFPTVPSFVTTGQFEGGDELDQLVLSRPLLLEERTNPAHLHRLQVWRPAGNPPSPAAWSVIASFDSAYEWSWLAAGDFTGNGLDEIATIDSLRGHLGVFRLGANRSLERLYANEKADREWRTVEFGQYTQSAGAEMVAVRNSSALNSLWAFRWINNQVSDFYTGFFLPPPRFAFLADIGGNGDVEIVALREVSGDESGERSRLFVRDNGNDPIALREDMLESDNGFLAGAGGDLNGDGRDAFVLIRDNRIRVYFEPNRNRDFVDYPLPTNQRTVHLGNLDTAGQQPLPRLDVTPATFDVTLVQGEVLTGLRAEVFSRDIVAPLNYVAITEAAQAWLSVTPEEDVTPGTITLRVDARSLNPGTYAGRVNVTSQTGGNFQSVEVDVTATVVAGIRINPTLAAVYYAPCTADAADAMLTFSVVGAVGTTFRPETFPEAPWISVEPDEATVPAQMTVTLRPSLLAETGDASATLVAQAVNSSAPAFAPEATIRLLCQDGLHYMPAMPRAVS